MFEVQTQLYVELNYFITTPETTVQVAAVKTSFQTLFYSLAH